MGAGALGLGLLVLIGLQTPSGLSAAADLASRLVSSATGLTVRLENVSGTFPVSLTLGRLAVADDKGFWLLAKDLHLAWSPLALLRGRIRVDALTADIIRVRRPPEMPPSSTEAPPQFEWPPRFPSLPPFLLNKLAINRLILDKELAGQDAVLTITGRLAESGQGAVALSLKVERQGGPPLALNLAGSLNYAQWRLAVQAGLTDAAGGLLAEALAGPGGGPLAVRFTGDGSLTDWKGRLDTELAGRTLATADLGLAVPLTQNAVLSWSLDARFTPPAEKRPAWAADLDRILGHGATISAAGRYGIVSGAIFLDKTTFAVDAGQVTATASLRPDTDALSATVDVSLPALARLDLGLAGSVALTLTATGSLARPDVALAVTTKDFRTGPLALDAARIRAGAKLAGDLGGVFPGAAVTVDGELTGLAGPDGTTLLGRDLHLALAADLAASGAVTARDVTLSGQGGSLRVSGEMAADSALAANLALTVRDLAGAASLGGLTLSGGAELSAKVHRDAAGAGKADCTLRLSKLATTAGTGPSAGLAGLLGTAPVLSAQVDMAGPALGVSNFSLDGARLRVRASGDMDTATGRMAAKVKADLPDLVALTPILGQPAAGELHLAAELGGPAGAPTATATVRATALRLGETRLSALDLEASAKDLIKAPAGRVRLSAKREQETAGLETTFAMAGRTLRLSGLRLTAPDTTLTATAAIDLDQTTVAGDLTVTSTDLTGLGRFVGQPLSGSLKLTATATTGRSGQGISAKFSASSLHAAGLALGELSLSAELADVLHLPRGQASLTAKGLETGGLVLSQTRLTASGDGRTMQVSLDTKGALPGGKPLTLATKARLAQTGKNRTVTIASLSGSLVRHPFALTAPATLTLGEGRYGLDALALTFDKARIAATGSLGPKAVAANLTVSKVSLPLLASFGVTGFDGTAGATVRLSGSPARPKLVAEAKVDGLRTTSTRGRGVSPMTVTTTVTLEGATLSATASLAQAGKKELLTARAALPARFALEPFAFTLPPGGALSGKVTADGDLTDIAALLAQANMRIVGKLAADLSLSGTLDNPQVGGSLGLTASRLENADAGLVLRDVVIRLDAAGGVLTVTEATGHDLRGGSFAITGKVGPFAAGDAPIAVTTKLSHLKVVGLDLVTATADGDVAVTGSLSRLAVRGKITLGPAEINLPTSLPPSVVVIPVTDINDPDANPDAKKHAPPAVARRVDLDVTVALGQAVYIRGMGMESRWAGQLTISGPADAPIGRGKFHVEQGTIDLIGTSLEITKGEVAFDGQSVTAPSLHILATNTIDDVTAGVSLTGDATNPTIALISKPPLADKEILSRMLFGQSASGLSAIQAAQLAQAAASLYAGGGPTSILARTRHILGLDQLSIVQGKGNLTSTMLRASKEIVKGVTVGVEQGMGAQSGAVSVEVKITPNITVDSRVGADNKQGVGVNWKWDY